MLLPAILCEEFWEADCCHEWGHSIPQNDCTSHNTEPLDGNIIWQGCQQASSAASAAWQK